jgi:hypothetical protein
VIVDIRETGAGEITEYARVSIAFKSTSLIVSPTAQPGLASRCRCVI